MKILYNQVFDVIKIDQMSDDILNFQINYTFFWHNFVCYLSDVPPFSAVYGIKDHNYFSQAGMKRKFCLYKRDIYRPVQVSSHAGESF